MRFLLLPAILLLHQIVIAQTGIPVPEMTGSDDLIKNFMIANDIPGASVAIAKDGRIVYMRAFGYSDLNGSIPTQPYNLFRIGSLSKQVTAVAIFKMMEEGKLSMKSKIFGVGGLLEHHPVFSTADIKDNRIYNITIQNLLEHSGGWNRIINCNPSPTSPYPFFINGCDPIAFPLRVTELTGTTNPVKKDALIKFLIEKGLDFAPGTAFTYSNIGFLILGEVIEQISGLSYETYVQKKILEPLGIFDMHIAKNLLSEKVEREGEYVGNGNTYPSVYGSGLEVPIQYGGINVNAMDAHGGWIATTRDMLKLLTAIDSFNTKPDILTPASIASMVTPSATNAFYSKGWLVNNNNWWFSGSLEGTASEQVRTNNGYTWIIILNKRNINSSSFTGDLYNLGWNCVAATSNFPAYDLMVSPTTNGSKMSFSNITGSAATINWTNGNGEKRLLIARADSAINEFPLDGTDYTANSVFKTGSVIGKDNYVVYNGSGNSATVNGLTAGKTYYFRLIEFNKNIVSGNNALYLLGANPVSSIRLVTTYIFTGNGNWNNVANWSNGVIPPLTLPPNQQIIIDPVTEGECVLDIAQTIQPGAFFIVQTGKKFRIPGNLIIQ